MDIPRYHMISYYQYYIIVPYDHCGDDKVHEECENFEIAKVQPQRVN